MQHYHARTIRYFVQGTYTHMHTHKKPQGQMHASTGNQTSQYTSQSASQPASPPETTFLGVLWTWTQERQKRDAPWRELHCWRGNFLLSPIAWRSNIRRLGEVFAMGKVSTEE